MFQRVGERDSAAHRMADENEAVELEMRRQRLDEFGIPLRACPIAGGRFCEAVPRKVDGDEAVVRRKTLDPGTPGVNRCTEAMDEHQRASAA